MNFKNFLESIESNYSMYLKRFKSLLPGRSEDYYDSHMQKIISQERENPNPPSFNDELFNSYLNDLGFMGSSEEFHGVKSQTNYSVNNETKNKWLRNSADPNNNRRVLCCQFSSTVLYSRKQDYSDKYYDKIYSKIPGYQKPEDFWEIPYWIAAINKNLNNSDVYIIRDLNEAINFFKKTNYKIILFSVMDVVLEKVKLIAKRYSGPIAVGGYRQNLSEELAEFKNVQVYKSMEDFILEQKNSKMVNGVNYSLFADTAVIPRLTLSQGCKHKCKFCDVARSVKQIPDQDILDEVNEISKLKSKLIYINDKTFGQSSNYGMLSKINNIIKMKNNNFEGFIIQTTASAFSSSRFNLEFMRDSGIKYIELGIETYNDEILKKYKKPSTEKTIDLSCDKIRDFRNSGLNIYLIANIIVGFPEETEQTYKKTWSFLLKNQDIISHLNIYNLAIYSNAEINSEIKTNAKSDNDENETTKSFHQDPKLHKKWHKKFIAVGNFLIKQK